MSMIDSGLITTPRHYEAVTLLSGGLDSTTCLSLLLGHYGHRQVLALSFDYGQRHRASELAAANRVARHYQVTHHIVNLSELTTLLGSSALTNPQIAVPDGHYAEESMKITVVPNRNAIMLSIAFGIGKAAGAKVVYAGMHAGDHAIYPDCRPDFVNAFSNAMALAVEGTPYLVVPFLHMTKAEIVKHGAERGVPYKYTYSCYKGALLHCGKCGTCVERKEAFELAGVPDPTIYAGEPTPA